MSKESALEYIARIHGKLNEDAYRKRFGDTTFSFALGVADRLFDEGKKPYLMNVIKEQGGLHTVCCCDDVIYDPYVGKAMHINKYRRKAFNKEVEMEKAFSTERVRLILER